MLDALTRSFNFHRDPSVWLFVFLIMNKESDFQRDLAILPNDELNITNGGTSTCGEPPDVTQCETMSCEGLLSKCLA